MGLTGRRVVVRCHAVLRWACAWSKLRWNKSLSATWAKWHDALVCYASGMVKCRLGLLAYMLDRVDCETERAWTRKGVYTGFCV